MASLPVPPFLQVQSTSVGFELPDLSILQELPYSSPTAAMTTTLELIQVFLISETVRQCMKQMGHAGFLHSQHSFLKQT